MGTLFAIAYADAALKALAEVEPKKIRRQIKGRIDSLMSDPYPQGCEKMETVKDGLYDVYRIRHGKHRILYSVRNDIEILVLDIGHRKDVYRNR